MKKNVLKEKFPDYPRTRHLPWKPNAVRDDLVASEEEAKVIFTENEVYVEEKVDGANCGMMLFDGHPVIRNRSHILSKGYMKDTPAKMQFRPAWNWFYRNKNLFDRINNLYGAPIGVYGEWCYALHGIQYDKLPSLFMPFDLYDPETEEFLSPRRSRGMMLKAGFLPVPLLHAGPVKSWEQLEKLCNEPSILSSTDLREGVYVKVCNERCVTHRFKMVREGFIQGSKWSEDTLTLNKVE